MTEVQRLPVQVSRPQNIPFRTVGLEIPHLSAERLPPASSSSNRARPAYGSLDAFSPVDQNGSFAFDRVLKCGYVQKRTRKTKAWKPIYLVLRPNTLSIYRNQREDKLRHKIELSDLTAVAFLKDPKHKKQNVFGLFSPSRNYHMEAMSRKDAEEWVSLIRREARIDEEEEEMLLASPGTYMDRSRLSFFDRDLQRQREERYLREERVGSSSPEPSDPIPRLSLSQRSQNGGLQGGSRGAGVGPTHSQYPSYNHNLSTYDYSGNEFASHSDLSDIDFDRARGASSISFGDTSRPAVDGQSNGLHTEKDPERVIWHGRLLYLKTKGGVRQWKDLWAVLRPRSLAVYKDESEYAPLLVLPMPNIISVVEVDPLSKTKRHCLQIITEEKSYKFCAHSEEMLDKCLGAFKSVIAKRKDGR